MFTEMGFRENIHLVTLRSIITPKMKIKGDTWVFK